MIANWIISQATGVKLHDYGCSLKVFRAEVVKPLRLYGEMHRFLPAIASELGVTIVEQVGEPPRRASTAQSKYGLGPDRPRRPGPDDGQVPAELRHAAAADLRAAGHHHGRPRAASSPATWPTSGCSRYQSIANRPLLLFGILLVFTGVQLITLGPAGRDAGAHVPRVAGQAHLRHPGNPRKPADVVGSRLRYTRKAHGQRAPCAFRVDRALLAARVGGVGRRGDHRVAGVLAPLQDERDARVVVGRADVDADPPAGLAVGQVVDALLGPAALQVPGEFHAAAETRFDHPVAHVGHVGLALRQADARDQPVRESAVAQATTSSPFFGQPPAGGRSAASGAVGGAGEGAGAFGVKKLCVSDHALDTFAVECPDAPVELDAGRRGRWLIVNLVSPTRSGTVTIAIIAVKDSFVEISKV
ncbi:MAG: hypothetical protein MZV64_73435 [Ignavibacteriales bacterium]|nr:hypothetical protein [Ignavibacteriales bacterium]